MKKNTKTPVPKQAAGPWSLVYLEVQGGMKPVIPRATVKLERNGKIVQDARTSENSMRAVFKTIDRLTKNRGKILYRLFSGLEFYEAAVSVNFGGKHSFVGKATSADIFEAGALAYLDALNQYLSDREGKATAY